MEIGVYADVVCPWCWMGEKRLDKALRERPDLDVNLRWRPFQLRPEMPTGGVPWRPFALEKFGGEENMAQGVRGHRVGADLLALAPAPYD
jgi:predicted DsbA family dithiol-disulfide isomerase